MEQYHTIIVNEQDDSYNQFLDLPFELYGEIAQRFKNQFALAGPATCILLFDGDKPCGRLALYENKDLIYNNSSAIAIGNYECIDDNVASSKLLESAFAIARQKGYNYVIGPMNGSTWKAYRFMDDQSKPLFFSENLHQPYYPQQFTDNGFGAISHYLSQVDTELVYGKYLYLKERFDKEQIQIRPIDMNNLEKELLLLYDLCSEVFLSNFLYTPINPNEFLGLYLPLMPLLKPDMIILAEDTQTGKLAGFIFAIPDLYDAAKKSIIVKTLARNPARKYAGITQLLCDLIMKYASVNNITKVYHAFMHVQNKSVNVSTKFSGDDYRCYTLYGREI